MKVLDDVKRWMTFIGWSDGGEPGSVKKDADGSIVANSGDNTWVKDIEDCIEHAEREAAIAELVRRSTLSATKGDA